MIKNIVFILLLLVNFSQEITAQEKIKEYRGNDSMIRYTGRTFISQEGDVTFDWSGVYLETQFIGDNLSILLSETGNSYYDVFLDGEKHKVVKACGKDTLITFVSNISDGFHQLRIQKRTEGEFGRTTIHRFVLSGTLLGNTLKRNRHIEFIGDSWTCGYGVEGKNRDESFQLETENSHFSYAAVLSRYFNADYTLIAHSGRGVARNYGDSLRVSDVTMKDKMQQIFDEDNEKLWDSKIYQPDLVIINLGINDFSTFPHPSKLEFTTAYKQILKQLRQNYGNIPLLCICPPQIQDSSEVQFFEKNTSIYDYYKTAIIEINDPKIYLLPINNGLLNNTTDLGAVWHPNKIGQKKLAIMLIPYISTIMKWKLPEKMIK